MPRFVSMRTFAGTPEASAGTRAFAAEISSSFRVKYGLSSSIFRQRAISSSDAKCTVCMSMRIARLMRRPPEVSMPRQFLNAAEISA